MILQPFPRTAGATVGELIVAVTVFGVIALGAFPWFEDLPGVVSKARFESDIDRGNEAREISPGSDGISIVMKKGDSIPDSSAPSSRPEVPKRPGQLEAPVISIPSGKFSITEFALPLFLYNPNRTGSSRVLYSVNNGGWTVYDGSAVMVSPDSKVTAYAEAIDPLWKNSDSTMESYSATPVELDPPLIRLSAPRFDFDANEIIEIVLENPNKLDSSVMEYRASGTHWDPYEGPFRMHVDDNPIGAVIEARAVPAKALYIESDVSYKNIEKGMQELSLSSGSDRGGMKDSRGDEYRVRDEAAASGLSDERLMLPD